MLQPNLRVRLFLDLEGLSCRWATSLQRGDPLSHLVPILQNRHI